MTGFNTPACFFHHCATAKKRTLSPALSLYLTGRCLFWLTTHTLSLKNNASVTCATPTRLQIRLKGLLQGIGFRPFVYRLAHTHQQGGWVANDQQHVIIEIEGDSQRQQAFLAQLTEQLPACGHISSVDITAIPVLNEHNFQLKTSLNNDPEKSAFICPDIAVCASCVAEMFDAHNRRYLHPFISCCHCGPRYSLIQRLPYDRCHTSLAAFPLCPRCLSEYQNPADRRFHAQTIACPDCGPQLSLHDANGQLIAQRHSALELAITHLQNGKIVAVKSIGGFQLLADAHQQATVLTLRQRKHRPSKPFALMVASLASAKNLCNLSPLEEQLLQSAAAPIVLADAKPHRTLAAAIAPQQTLLGLMLAYTPLHHLLLQTLGNPLLATSGNLHDEPLCIDNRQAFHKLAGIADFFLCHDRPILRTLDDSIVRVIANKATVLRRARGYVPTPIRLTKPVLPTLAVGGQMKNTIALAQQQHVILSQHLGDLSALETQHNFLHTINDLQTLYACRPQQIMTDLHPDYVSTQTAQHWSQPTRSVQHHYAHSLSCMAEHQLTPPVIGVAWDGTGLGTDRQLWGGEFFMIQADHWQRCASLRPFPLVGGLQAIKEPRRAALGLLYACLGNELFSPAYTQLHTVFSTNEYNLLKNMLKKSIHCPMTSSIGRLFDAVASLLNLRHVNDYEGQAAMALEQVTMNDANLLSASYCFTLNANDLLHLDWQPVVMAILTDLAQLTPAQIAVKFHYALANALLAVIAHIMPQGADLPVVLSGGCFQNAYLVQAIERGNLRTRYRLFYQQQVPPNDGGIALGQIFAATLS